MGVLIECGMNKIWVCQNKEAVRNMGAIGIFLHCLELYPIIKCKYKKRGKYNYGIKRNY
jgi:hypothetical protein